MVAPIDKTGFEYFVQGVSLDRTKASWRAWKIGPYGRERKQCADGNYKHLRINLWVRIYNCCSRNCKEYSSGKPWISQLKISSMERCQRPNLQTLTIHNGDHNYEYLGCNGPFNSQIYLKILHAWTVAIHIGIKERDFKVSVLLCNRLYNNSQWRNILTLQFQKLEKSLRPRQRPFLYSVCKMPMEQGIYTAGYN
jgi:hypothetical protein